MKSVICLIAIIGFACAYDASTSMPDFYHQTLSNNLNEASGYPADATVTHIASKQVLASISKGFLLNFLAKHMDLTTFEQAIAQIEQLIHTAKHADSHQTFHALIANFLKNKAQAYEITLARSHKHIKAVLSKKHFAEVPVAQNKLHVETYLSQFGLPFEQISAPKTDATTTETVNAIKFVLLNSANAIQGHRQMLKGSVSSVTGAINDICDTYQKIATTFKTTKSKTFKGPLK